MPWLSNFTRGAILAVFGGVVCLFLESIKLTEEVSSDDSTEASSPSIPKIIWTTGMWSRGSDEVKKMRRNIGPVQAIFYEQDRLADQRRAEQAFLAWAPPGTDLRYIDDAEMDSMTEKLALALESEGVHGVLEAFHTLRPGAFRADIWRLLALWSHGGVYVDGNIRMKMNFSQFIDFEKDQLVLVTDPGMNKQCLKHGPAFWNAVMASSPRNKYLLAAIKGVVQNIKRHSYEWCTLFDITGPSALGNIITSMPDYKKDIRIEYEWTYRPGLSIEGSVRKIGDHDRILCDKDLSLHDVPASDHYGQMWNNHQVYCDEKGPEGALC